MWMVISDLGLINLVGGIIRNTSQDIHYANVNTEEGAIDFLEAEIFLQSQWFEELVSIFPKDPDKIKCMIYNKKIAYRRSYEG